MGEMVIVFEADPWFERYSGRNDNISVGRVMLKSGTFIIARIDISPSDSVEIIINTINSAKESGANAVFLCGDIFDEKIFIHCKMSGIKLSFVLNDVDSYKEILGCQDMWCLSSKQTTDYELLRMVAKTSKPVYIMTDNLSDDAILKDVITEDAIPESVISQNTIPVNTMWNCLEMLCSYDCPNITVVYTSDAENLIDTITTAKQKFGCDTGCYDKGLSVGKTRDLLWHGVSTMIIPFHVIDGQPDRNTHFHDMVIAIREEDDKKLAELRYRMIKGFMDSQRNISSQRNLSLQTNMASGSMACGG